MAVKISFSEYLLTEKFSIFVGFNTTYTAINKDHINTFDLLNFMKEMDFFLFVFVFFFQEANVVVHGNVWDDANARAVEDAKNPGNGP